MINRPSPVGNGWKKQDEYLVPNYLTKDHSPKYIESLMSYKCTTGCRINTCRCRKNSLCCTEVCLCPSNSEYEEEDDDDSYNQRLAIVIVNVEGFKDLQIHLQD